MQILDLATGNGIWAIELASNLASSIRPFEIVGLDISDGMFPVKHTWADNVTFRTYDMFDDVPVEYVEKFDVVHVRFIIAAIFKSTGARDRVIKNFTHMLKPGGYLQWLEPPAPVFVPVDFHSDGSISMTREYDEVFKVIDKHISVQRKSEWINQMDKVVEEVGGYVDVRREWPKGKKERLRYENDLLRWNSMEAVAGLLKMVKDEKGRKEIQEAVGRMVEDIVSGKKVFGSSVIVVVGRKPE